MGLYANFTGGRITISREPMTINNIVYDPETHKQDIKGFKWFKNKSEAYKYFGLERKIHIDFDD